MAKHRVLFFHGDYPYRQMLANEKGVDVYIEHHFNTGPKEANYCMAVVAHNAPQKSIEIAETYVDLVSKKFNIPKCESDPPGVKICRFRERGDFNLRFLKMPGLIVMPLFVSNADHVRMLIDEGGHIALAEILTETIRTHFPKGGLIGLSVGHKYRRKSPTDRGAPVRNYPEYYEADVAEWVLWQVKYMLEGGG
ncbi:MAG: hypothetical protein DRJ47_06525 [Thermoprotei archaeon]|nr:MAG: hypothetical protein DRJ47_06525 [Thermoprotei archaeon]